MKQKLDTLKQNQKQTNNKKTPPQQINQPKTPQKIPKQTDKQANKKWKMF